jgi:hypothetical protein
MSETLLNEQNFLRKLIGNSIDDFLRIYGDDAAVYLDRVLLKGFGSSENFISRGGKTFLKSASGAEINVETVRSIIDMTAKGRVDIELINLLPPRLVDGTDLRQTMLNVIKYKKRVPGQQVVNVVDNLIHPYQKRFVLPNCFSGQNCPGLSSIISNFKSKFGNIAKYQFNPSKVKVLSRAPNIADREVLEVVLEDGTHTLIYKSSGNNFDTTGKKVGEWFVIPGFASNGHFTKVIETINLTKGGNKYLTDMAKFLERYGWTALGK